MPLKLYNYFRSSTSYRTRIALNLKGLAYEYIPVHLRKGEQRDAAFLAMNPAAGVPVLDDGGQLFSQTLAIIEYLDETHPEPPLLPPTPAERARVRAFAQVIACDIHPLSNLRVLQRLASQFGADADATAQWVRYWVGNGLVAAERMLVSHGPETPFCFGDKPGLADVCLVPQIAGAVRFDCDTSVSPRLMAVHDRCVELPAFRDAAPANQPDAE